MIEESLVEFKSCLKNNTDFPWVNCVYAITNFYDKKVKIITNKYNLIKFNIRDSLLTNTHLFVKSVKELNKKEIYQVQLVNMNYMYCLFNYIMNNYYNIFSFKEDIIKLLNIVFKKSDYIINYHQKTILNNELCTEKHAKNLQLRFYTFNRYREKYNDRLQYGYFIIFTLKQRVCNDDLVRNICNFI